MVKLAAILDLQAAKVITVTGYEFGKISTLAAATLRELGYLRATALEGGLAAWREAGYPMSA